MESQDAVHSLTDREHFYTMPRQSQADAMPTTVCRSVLRRAILSHVRSREEGRWLAIQASSTYDCVCLRLSSGLQSVQHERTADAGLQMAGGGLKRLRAISTDCCNGLAPRRPRYVLRVDGCWVLETGDSSSSRHRGCAVEDGTG